MLGDVEVVIQMHLLVLHRHISRIAIDLSYLQLELEDHIIQTGSTTASFEYLSCKFEDRNHLGLAFMAIYSATPTPIPIANPAGPIPAPIATARARPIAKAAQFVLRGVAALRLISSFMDTRFLPRSDCSHVTITVGASPLY